MINTLFGKRDAGAARSARGTLATVALVAAVGFVAPVAPVASAGDPGLPGIAELIEDRMIVHLEPGVKLDTFVDLFEAAHDDVFLMEHDSIPGRDMYELAVDLPLGYTQFLLDAIEVDLELNYIGTLVSGELLYGNSAPEGHTGSTYVDSVGGDLFTGQYAADMIGLGEAQTLSQGAGVTVAVLDTGIDATHPQFAARVLSNGFDFIDNDATPDDVENGVDDDGDDQIDEMVGHGTFVAGLINLVAPDAWILPVRVLNSDGEGDGWLLTKAIYYAIDQGVEVINLSLGSTYKTETVDQAIDDASDLGIVVVGAAGNLNRDEPEEHPAMSGGLGVAATDHNDLKADFSNFNEDLFISAPGSTVGLADGGHAIVSTIPNGGYAIWEGTSFAVPFVSGTAALIRGQHPDWLPNGGTTSAIQAILAATAVDIYAMNPAFAEDEQLGYGRLHAGAAISVGPPAPKLGDLNNSGAVDVDDLLTLLSHWGEGPHTICDLSGDGIVGISDLLLLLANWG